VFSFSSDCHALDFGARGSLIFCSPLLEPHVYYRVQYRVVFSRVLLIPSLTGVR
jgi:hypothetical protein